MCAIVSALEGSSHPGGLPGRGCRGAACPSRSPRCLLARAGLRPTRQRLELVRLIFAGANRHLTPEELNQEVLQAGTALSLATVYNTLNHLTEAGLLRRIHLAGRTYFDTDVSEHVHFLVEGAGRPVDVEDDLKPTVLPFTPPAGMEVVRTEVVVHLRKRPTR